MLSGFDWGEQLPTLSSPRVVLRWLRDKDAADVFAVFRDPQVMRYWSTPPLTDLAATEALIREIHDLFRSRTLFQWGITSPSNDAILGTCTLFHLDWDHRRAEVGFALGKRYWGQGLASEAVELLIGFRVRYFGSSSPGGRRGPAQRPLAAAARAAGLPARRFPARALPPQRRVSRCCFSWTASPGMEGAPDSPVRGGTSPRRSCYTSKRFQGDCI